jgi:hypothetical protein
MDELDLHGHSELVRDLYELGLSLEAACMMEQDVQEERHTNPFAESVEPFDWALAAVKAVEYRKFPSVDAFNGEKLCRTRC